MQKKRKAERLENKGLEDNSLKNKRAVEAIIATVFIIGITVSAFGVIYVYVFPVIKEGVQKSQKCGEAQLYIESAKGFTCYDSSNQQLQVMIQRGSKDYDLGGIGVSVRTGGTSSVYNIFQSPNPYVRMVDGEYGEQLVLPGVNDGKVYVLNLNGDADEIGVAPLIKVGNDAKLCDITSSAKEVPSCSSVLAFNLFVFTDNDANTLNSRWGWSPTGFAASNNNLEFIEGSNSLQVNGKGSAGFNPSISIDKVGNFRFSYKKDVSNPDAYISVFYHVAGNGANEWIEFTDDPGRGYRGVTIPHYNDNLWHTEQIDLSTCQDSGQCAGYSQKGVIDNFQFAAWNSSIVYFDNAYFY